MKSCCLCKAGDLTGKDPDLPCECWWETVLLWNYLWYNVGTCYSFKIWTEAFATWRVGYLINTMNWLTALLPSELQLYVCAELNYVRRKDYLNTVTVVKIHRLDCKSWLDFDLQCTWLLCLVLDLVSVQSAFILNPHSLKIFKWFLWDTSNTGLVY